MAGVRPGARIEEHGAQLTAVQNVLTLDARGPGASANLARPENLWGRSGRSQHRQEGPLPTRCHSVLSSGVLNRAYPHAARFQTAHVPVRATLVVVSRPIRRILLRTLAERPPAAIPLGRQLPAGSSGPPGGVGVRAALPLSGLAPGGVCRATRVTPGAGALLPHRFTLTCATGRPAAIGGLFSVALSCGSPRLGVTQHRALWSPDVPRTDQVGTRPPGRLTTTAIVPCPVGTRPAL